MGRRFFWFKFKDDFFQNLKIKKLRKIAGGDTYTIIYLKLMLLALKTDGYLYFEEVYETFAEELAEKIDEEIENVKLTLQYLLSVQLIELSEDGKTCYLKELKNCIGSESASTQRVRDYRERQKQQKALQCNAQPLQCNTDVTQALQCNTNVTEALQCNADVTQVKRVCNVEKRRVDIDIDINNSDINNNLLINNININKNKKEKEKEKEKEKKKTNVFIPPTVDEVREYCSERKNNVNPEEFVSFYASKGWMIGKNKMKSWKQAVVTWELRHKRDVPLEDSSDSSKVPPRQQDTPKSTPRVNPRNFLNFEQTYATEDFEQIERCCLDN